MDLEKPADIKVNDKHLTNMPLEASIHSDPNQSACIIIQSRGK